MVCVFAGVYSVTDTAVTVVQPATSVIGPKLTAPVFHILHALTADIVLAELVGAALHSAPSSERQSTVSKFKMPLLSS